MKKIVSISLILFIAFAMFACSADTVICSSCNTQCDAEMAFCASCGASLTRSCASCGYKCEPNALFCSNCGRPFENSEGGNGDRSVEDGAGDGAETSKTSSGSEESLDASNAGVESEKSEPEITEKDPSEIWLLLREEIGKNATFEYEYDYYGRITASKMKPYDNESITLLETVYTYDENGYLKSSATDNDLFGSYSEYTYKIETSETSKGVRVTSEICLDAQGNESSKMLYTYNGNGQLVETKEYISGYLTKRTEYDPESEKVIKEYDSSDNLTNEYFYNENGQCYEENVYQDGKVSQRATFTFDHNGNPSKRTGVSVNDGSVIETYYVYKSLERYRIENNLVP